MWAWARPQAAAALTVALTLLAVGATTGGARAPAHVAGGRWVPVGPQVFVDRLASTPDGRHLVAGGSGLYVSRAAGRHWTQVGPFSAADPVIALALPAQGPLAVLVGTDRGLFAAPSLDGPYRRLPLAPSPVHGVLAVPGRPGVLWASSGSGMWRSDDDGTTWAPADAGLPRPGTAWALAWWQGAVYGSDALGVYRWTAGRWQASSDQFGVVSLDATAHGLFASSMGAGEDVLTGDRWRRAASGLPVHRRGPVAGVHVVSVTAPGRGAAAYAGTMIDGAAVSWDHGRTWAPAWPGLSRHGVVWRVLPTHGGLLAATDLGLLAWTPSGAPSRADPSRASGSS
jgi:hypothetical protein